MRDKLHEVSSLADSIGLLASDIVDDFDIHRRCAINEEQLRELLKELNNKLEGLNL